MLDLTEHTAETDLSQLAPWSYRQADELRRTFELPSNAQALNFIVAVIVIAEESALKLGFWLEDSRISITLGIHEGGAPENLAETLQDIERLAHGV